MEFTMDGEMLVMRVPVQQPGSRSTSGKSLINASTRGAVSVPGTDMVVVLTVYTKR